MFSRESLGKEIEERAHRNSFHEFGTVAGREMRINEALLVLMVMIITMIVMKREQQHGPVLMKENADVGGRGRMP